MFDRESVCSNYQSKLLASFPATYALKTFGNILSKQ